MKANILAMFVVSTVMMFLMSIVVGVFIPITFDILLFSVGSGVAITIGFIVYLHVEKKRGTGGRR